MMVSDIWAALPVFVTSLSHSSWTARGKLKLAQGRLERFSVGTQHAAAVCVQSQKPSALLCVHCMSVTATSWTPPIWMRCLLPWKDSRTMQVKVAFQHAASHGEQSLEVGRYVPGKATSGDEAAATAAALQSCKGKGVSLCKSACDALA